MSGITEELLKKALSLVEKDRASIAASNADIPLPDWQKQELDRRYQEFKEGKLELHDCEAVHQDLRQKYN